MTEPVTLPDVERRPVAAKFPRLEAVTSPAVDTAQAAYYLNRKPQTLRIWACYENGPLRPLRVNGRLAWKVEDIRAVLRLEVVA